MLRMAAALLLLGIHSVLRQLHMPVESWGEGGERPPMCHLHNVPGVEFSCTDCHM